MNMLAQKSKSARHRSDTITYAKLGILTTITLIVVGLTYFLYGEFYQTIVQARTVLVLKQEVALEDVELEAFNRVRAVHQYKQSNILPSVIPDPFRTSGAAAAAETAPVAETVIPPDTTPLQQFPSLFQ